MARPPLRIDSPQNPRFRTWEAVLDGRGLKKHGQFLLAGQKTVPEALVRWPERFTTVLATDEAGFDRLPPLPDSLERVVLARELFRRLDVSGTEFPLLAGPVADLPTADLTAPPRGLELVVALGDPANLGAVLRSAAAFGVAGVVLLAEAAHPFHPKCLRAASNAVFSLSLRRGPDWTGMEAAAGPLVALDGTGEEMPGFGWPEHLRLVLGEEGQGVPASLPALRVAIPTTGAVESLNATVAASIALYSAFGAARPPRPAPPRNPVATM